MLQTISNDNATRQPVSTATRARPDLVGSIGAIASYLQSQARLAPARKASKPKTRTAEEAFHDVLIERALAAAGEAQRRIAEQSARIAYLEQLAMRDELTGLLNRRAFEAELRHALAAARRFGEAGVLIYIDLDNFKPVNDRYGHAAGDHVLKQVAKLLASSVRETDFVGRMGGDEFGLLLVRTGWKAGLAQARRLERALNNAYVPWAGNMIKIKASFGIQAYGAEDTESGLMNRADIAMYRNKRRRTTADAHLLS